MIGVPIVSIYLYYASDETEYILSKRINECKKGEEIQKHIRYFLHFADHRGKERDVDIILKGYVYNHEEGCTESDCPLKDYKKYLDRGHLSEKHDLQNSNISVNKFSQIKSKKLSLQIC
jgi:hypothetical protein